MRNHTDKTVYLCGKAYGVRIGNVHFPKKMGVRFLLGPKCHVFFIERCTLSKLVTGEIKINHTKKLVRTPTTNETQKKQVVPY